MNRKQRKVMLVIRCSDALEREAIKTFAWKRRESVQQFIMGLVKRAMGYVKDGK